jgi:alkaline phosphatase D
VQPISRRRFLATSAIVIVSTATACSGDSGSGAVTSAPEPTEPPAPDTTAAPPTTSAPTTTTPPVDLPDDPFTLGVASGDASVGSVVLWTRLAPDPLAGGGMPADAIEVTWEVARDEAFGDIVATGTELARPEHGHSLHVRAELDPGWWFYRFRVGGYTSPVGRTQRAPSMTAEPEAVRFASANCQNYQNGYYTAHRDIADQQPDFVVWLGDYIYEGASRPVDGNDVVRSHDGTDEVRTLEQYRNRYARYRSDTNLQAAHAACPWYVIWDDHEVENNYAGLVPERPEDAEGFAERRQAAYQAWWEHMPVDLPAPDGSAEFRIYRGFRWGSLLDLALLDGRQYRTDQACGDTTLNVEPACAETFDEDRTMLGSEQEAWLLDTLGGEAPAVWNVIGNQTVFGDLMLGEAVLNYDQWDGYPLQRNRILEQLSARDVSNLVVLTGDIHFAGTGNLRVGERGTGTPIGVEFVATSISSGGLVNPAVTEVLVAFPDIVDVELEHRGYILHTVTPEQWRADYRMVETVKTEDAPLYTHAVYVVDVGTNTVRPAD